MKKTIIATLSLLLAALLLSGCFALQEAEQASGVAVAPTIALPVATSAPSGSAQTSDAAAASSGGLTVYTLDANQSEARFIVNEVLRGADTRVVGVTDNVAGQIALDLSNPTTAQIGEIVINARDIATDNNFRNNAIRNEILLTDSHEFITFTPTRLSGLPERAEVGQTYRFQIAGDLTIIGRTQPVTFDATVTATSATELQGDAAVTIAYADWGISVPLSRMVTAVEDQVTLELSFMAQAAEAGAPASAEAPTADVAPTVEVAPVVEAVPQPSAVTYNTPAQTEGPYYPVQKPAEQDNDLTVIAGATGAPAGELLAFSGQLYDAAGQPVAGAVIEIWQADANGIYLHPQDPKASQRDPNFQSYGETTTAADGSYRFKTILPGLYEPRPRHIHVKVKLNGQELLTTQFYFDIDETLTTQGMFLQDGSDGSALIISVTQTPDDQGNLWWVGQRDIVLSVQVTG